MSEILKPPLSFGNRKLNGGNTMIWNITSATDCEADRLSMCPLGPRNGDGSCYAAKAERLYLQVLPYRRNQTTWWDNHSDPEAFVRALKPRTKFFRFSEAGDFRNQEDVDKMTSVCERLSTLVRCYGYTRRHDLNFTELRRFAVVIVTGHSVTGCSRSEVIGKHDAAPPGYHLCPGKNCMTDCKMCVMRNKKIAFRKH